MKAFALALAVLCSVSVATLAEDCTIGVYADPAGQIGESCAGGGWGVRFSVYVVLFTEDTVAAAAYSLTWPADIYVQDRFSGPSGNGLVIDEPLGTNVALAECAIGFGGNPVLVDEYWAVTFSPDLNWNEEVMIGPNASQDPESPLYVTCNDLTRQCGLGPNLRFTCDVASESRSVGAIKSLYHDG